MEELNQLQQKAVELILKPLLVIAGPGSGKTKVLVSKLEYLINKRNIPPEKILLLTYTKKACDELISKIKNKINLSNLNIFTFHSLAYKILISQSNSNIKIISEAERSKLIQTIFKKFIKFNLQYKILPLKELKLIISNAKKTGKVKNIFFEKILEKYNEYLSKNNLVDFDDLILKASKILKKQVPKKFQYDYILIDEFQDTSESEYTFVKNLIQEKTKITVVGDPNQSIYNFRGSSSEIFQKFKNDFLDSVEINLNINYRNPQKIINLAENIVSNKYPQTSANNFTGNISLIETLDPYSQADFVINKITQQIGGIDFNNASNETNENFNFSDFAVLFRTHFESKILIEKFNNANIPFYTGQEELFSQNPVIRFILNHLKAYLNNYKDIGNYIEGIKINKFLNLDFGNLNIKKIINIIIKKYNLAELIEDNFMIELNYFSNIYKNLSIEKFVKLIENIKDENDYINYSNKVSLLTLHSSKGLEFKNVFIISFNKGIIPYLHKEKIEIEEEKKLFYVGLTRASKNLFIVYMKEKLNKAIKISEFEKYFNDNSAEKIVDPRINFLKKRKEKYKAKKSQMQLFS